MAYDPYETKRMRRHEIPERIQSDDVKADGNMIHNDSHSSINLCQQGGENAQINYYHYEININIPETYNRGAVSDILNEIGSTIQKNNRPLHDQDNIKVEKKWRLRR
jgi:hypothetical protein